MSVEHRTNKKRCLYCGQIPRSKVGKENLSTRYPGYCSYDHQERHNLHLALEFLRNRQLSNT